MPRFWPAPGTGSELPYFSCMQCVMWEGHTARDGVADRGTEKRRNLLVNKLIAIAAVFSAFVAMSVPSFAQSYDPSAGSGNIVSGPKGGMQAGASSRPLYNYAPLSGHHHARHRMRYAR